MSLKTFHLIFIACACLLCVGLGIWFLVTPMLDFNTALLASGGAFLGALLLIGYEVWVWHKLEHEIY